MGVASGCGEQEVGVASGSGWNLWVWLLGVVVRRYIDFLILLIPTPLVSVLFCSSIPSLLFCSFLKIFFVLYNIIYMQLSFSNYKHIRAYFTPEDQRLSFCLDGTEVHLLTKSSSIFFLENPFCSS